MELQTACQWWVTASRPCKILRFSSNHTHLSKSSTIKALGCTFRVAGGGGLSGAGIPAALEQAWSSCGVLTDGSSELQLRNLP